jgi:flagellar basal body-associated protein FliL
VIYLVICLIVAACGMYIQFKYFYDGDKKKNKKEEEKPLNQAEQVAH